MQSLWYDPLTRRIAVGRTVDSCIMVSFRVRKLRRTVVLEISYTIVVAHWGYRLTARAYL